MVIVLGRRIWDTPVIIPVPSGLVYDTMYYELDVSVDSDGYPWVTYNLLDGWWASPPLSGYMGVVYTCVVRAANVNGTAWGTAANIGGGEYNSYGTGISIHRLSSGKMMMISNLGSGLGSYYKSSTSWTGIAISDQFAWEYGDSRLNCSIQSVSDKCKNIYVVWFGIGQSYTYHDGVYHYYPDKLYLSIFNTDRGTWATTLLRETGPGVPWVSNISICYGSNGNIYIYYAKGSDLCRVSILGCVDGNIGSIQPEVVVSTESAGIGQIECLEYVTLNPYTGTQDVVLSFKVGTDFRYIVDRVLILPEDIIETVEIYRHGSDESYYTPLINLSGPLLTYLDLNPPEDTLYYYALRTQGESGAHSVFTKVNVPYDYLQPQIELSGRGGFNALRHAIYTTHNATDGDRDAIIIKLWEGDLTDASELESTSSPNIILTGDKKVETRNVEPFTTDTFVTGSEVDAWKRIYSETSKTDKNTSARVRLKNGR
jgi:hypothetical protein